MKFKALRNSSFRGKAFQKGEEYELNDDEQRIIGRFFEGVPSTPAPKKAEAKKEAPKVEPVAEEAEEAQPEEEKPKSKAKRK